MWKYSKFFSYAKPIRRVLGALEKRYRKRAVKPQALLSLAILKNKSMHGSTNFLSPPTFAEIHCSCNKVYHKQELRFLLFIPGQNVT